LNDGEQGLISQVRAPSWIY